MDVGNILFRDLDRVCWKQLADESSPYTVCVPWMLEQNFGNHFVAARKGDEFIKRWHDLFVHVERSHRLHGRDSKPVDHVHEGF